MSVEIPWARIASAAIRQRLFTGTQEGALGGPDLAIPRMGDRFAIDVETAQLRQDAQGRALIAALTVAAALDARMVVHEPDLPRPSSAGPTVRVAGGGQAGSTLRIRGARKGAVIVTRKYLTIVHGGKGYLHMVTADVRVGADGTAALPLWPMLRFLTADDEAVAIDRPFIEGRLLGFDGKGAKWVRNRIDPFTFSIEERA
ncbi:hypothetical protein GGQ80_002091 [Sphingomonas jinjuensis]|uniref:Uncharacterized protein n=1 Tax=Sphingomonas jinjuensis TaxID=535907 RepID=A0A840FBV7_9SPHN|nr:hypothetical protein [Sphingomonas jinjuensis]MBB4154181.1 hypothetical protein [Sphingomonas jinjuensis]